MFQRLRMLRWDGPNYFSLKIFLLYADGKITRQERGFIFSLGKRAGFKKSNVKNLMQFFILFEIKILEPDVPYFIPLSSSLIFFHFSHTEFQSGITTVAGTNQDRSSIGCSSQGTSYHSVTFASVGFGYKWPEMLNPVQSEPQVERASLVYIYSHLIV